MKRLFRISVPALVVLMSIGPSFSQSYIEVDLSEEKIEEPVKRLEPIEPIKIEPRGIELKKVEIPKIEIKPLVIPKAVINLDSDDEAEEIEVVEDKKEEEKKEEKVEVAEDKKEEEKKEEKVEVAEDKKEEKKEEKVEITKTEVVRQTTYEELTGLVCRQQQQLDKVTTSIDSLIKSMDKQLELINSLTQLMMANQLAASSTPQYGPNLFQQPSLMSNYEAMLFGQRMGSMMNIFSPVQSFNGFGLMGPQQQPQAPNYTYNYYGPQQPQAQMQQYQPQMQQQAMPQYAPYDFGNISGGSIDNSARTMEYLIPQQAAAPAMQMHSI